MDYQLLPFRFKRFNDTEYLLTNEVGEYIFLQNEDFHHLVNGELDIHSDLFYDIESKQIATTDKVEDVVSMLATKFFCPSTSRIPRNKHGPTDCSVSTLAFLWCEGETRGFG